MVVHVAHVDALVILKLLDGAQYVYTRKQWSNRIRLTFHRAYCGYEKLASTRNNTHGRQYCSSRTKNARIVVNIVA